MDNEMMNKDGGKCGCFHHGVAGWAVFLFGLMFFIRNAFGWLSDDFVMIAWPILVLVVGCMKVCRGMCKCCDGGSCGNGNCC